MAAQGSALLIAELQNKLHALCVKLCIAAEGVPLSVAASLASCGSFVRLSIIAREHLPYLYLHGMKMKEKLHCSQAMPHC